MSSLNSSNADVFSFTAAARSNFSKCLLASLNSTAGLESYLASLHLRPLPEASTRAAWCFSDSNAPAPEGTRGHPNARRAPV